MATEYFTAEGVPTDGTALTSSNQGASGDAIIPTTASGGTIIGTATTGEVIHGSRSVKLTAGPSAAAYLLWQESNLPAVGYRTYQRLSLPSANYTIQRINTAAGTEIAAIILMTNGKLLVQGASTSLYTTPYALTLPGVYGIDMAVQPGTTSTNGKISFAVYDASGNLAAGMTAPFENTACDLTTSTIGQLDVGKPEATAVSVTTIVDSVKKVDGYGLVGPETALTAVIAGGATTGLTATTTRNLSAAGSNGTTYQWTQTAGPSVTITGASTANASYVVPATTTDSSITIQLKVGDGTSWSEPTSVTDTIDKYPVWFMQNGSLVAGTFHLHKTPIGTTTVSVSNITSTTATLSWTAVSGATGYLVGRDGTDSNGQGPWSQTDAANITSQTFTSLNPSTTYTLYCTPQPGGQQQSIQITTAAAAVQAQSWDWSDSNLPWAYSSTSDFTTHWPSGLNIVDIQTGSSDFFTNLQNTVNAAGARCIVRLGAGVYHLNQFRMIGSSGDPTYAFGFWFPNLQGFLGQGPDKTFIQMDANSMSQAQLDKMSTMTSASFAPLLMGLCRIDGSSTSPVYIGGVTFRADDQQMLTTVASDVPAVVPQPAPHQGVVLYSGTYGIVSYCRFQGAGRAMTSSPPFEMANIATQKGSVDYYNCEFDGRKSPDLDAAQPRRCGPYMGNNETRATHTDSWFHHTNVSRYAVNDQNANTSGTYTLTRCKSEQISNTHNVDPALNNGQSLGGYTNASLFGWESCNGTIALVDCIIDQDNPYTDSQIAQHLQFTSVGNRNPQGGRLTVTRGTFRNSGFPSVDGFLCIRAIADTYWVIDGYNTTMNITGSSGQRKGAYVISGTWPPSAASLAAAGVTPDTHYLVHN